MNKRLVFLPGFGENEQIFRPLSSELKQQLPPSYTFLFTDYRPILAQHPLKNIDLNAFIDDFIQHYKLTKADVLIGHSTGGWFAHHIKQRLDCPNCLIAAFTTPTKTRGYRKLFKDYRWVIKFGIHKGYLGSWLHRRRADKQYAHLPSHAAMQQVLRSFKTYSNHALWQMMQLIDSSPPTSPIEPNIRIHGTHDLVVYPPDEPYHQTPSDHFSLYTHPKIHATIIQNWLDEL